MYTSYSKVIIDLKGKRSVDLVRKTPCLCGEFTLAGALRHFIDNSSIARRALESPHIAHETNTALTKALYRFLKRQDFEPKLLVGAGFKRNLSNCAPQLEDEIKQYGVKRVVKELTHGVVRVNDLVFDLTFKRLGDTYCMPYNFPYRDWSPCWEEVKPMSHIADMTADDTQRILRNAHHLVKESNTH